MSTRPYSLSLCVSLLALTACGGTSADASGQLTDGTGGSETASGGSATGSGGSGTSTGGVVATAGATSVGNGGAVVNGSGGSVTTTTGGAQTAGGAGAGGATTVPGILDETMTMTTVSVPPGGEVYKCQDFKNPFGYDVGIVATNTELAPGSHHMFAFVIWNIDKTFNAQVFDCPSGGTEFHEYITTSGSPTQVKKYPAGVGRPLLGYEAIRLNVHMLNTGSTAKQAYAKFTMSYTKDLTSLKYKAGSVFLNQLDLKVPAYATNYTSERKYALQADINLMGGGGHMHKHGINFIAKTLDGKMLYQTQEWSEPQPNSFDPPLFLAKGTVISWACTYNNPGGTSLIFGESAQTNEMCIYPAEYYNTTGEQINCQTAAKPRSGTNSLCTGQVY